MIHFQNAGRAGPLWSTLEVKSIPASDISDQIAFEIRSSTPEATDVHLNREMVIHLVLELQLWVAKNKSDNNFPTFGGAL